METYIRSRNHFCPSCGEKDLDYLPIPKAQLTYTNSDGENVTEHMGETRDFKCRNCDCEFILVNEDE